jgi:hypothetical protein
MFVEMVNPQAVMPGDFFYGRFGKVLEEMTMQA